MLSFKISISKFIYHRRLLGSLRLRHAHQDHNEKRVEPGLEISTSNQLVAIFDLDVALCISDWS
jgi:hypothetical protein